MLDLGKYKDKTVTTNDENMNNLHVCVIGASGSGKSVECQRMIVSAVNQGATVIALDMHGTLADDQIFWKYRQAFEQYTHNIHAHTGGIGCNLLTPAIYPDGTAENSIDVVGSITEVLAEAIGAGSAQRTELRKAFQYVYDCGDYEKYGIRALDTALHNAGTKTAEILRDKLYFLTAHNVFVPGKKLFEENRINVFRFSRFDLKSQQLIAEIFLSYLWRLANAEQFKANPIWVFCDECQNLPSGKNHTLAQILSEGRKLGVNLILATQILDQGNVSAVQQRILQCGLKLYFKPAANKVSMTARLLDPARESDWSRLLRTLGIGEFIADGNFLVDGKERCEPLKIIAFEKRTT